MDKHPQIKHKGMQLNLMVILSVLMLIPASSMISNQMHWKTSGTPPLVLPGPVAPTLGLAEPAARPLAMTTPNEVDRVNSAVIAEPRQRTQLLVDGNSVQENFDHEGKRVSKILSSPEGALLNRWNFEPATGRILRFEIRDYRGTEVAQRRVAHWRYTGSGGFVKTNFMFESGAKLSGSFVESVSDQHIKYQERWYDSKRRLVSEKNWHPESGKFISFFMTTYGLGGWATQTSMDERGNELHKQLLTPAGKNVTKIGRVQIG